MKGSHSIPDGRKKSRQDNVGYERPQADQARASQAQSIYARDAVVGKRKRSKAPIVVAILAVLAVALVACGVFLFTQKSPQTGEVRTGERITVSVPSGASSSQIADLLQKSAVIASADEFGKRVSELGQTQSLQSGTYIFTGGDDLDNIIRMMTNGETGYLLVIPEGYTLKQIANEVEKTCGIDASGFYALTQQAPGYVAAYPFLENVYNGSMEGFLYPDSYRVDVGADADAVIRMMLDRFSAQIATVDMSYAASKNLTPYDVVTLASMVEKEFKAEENKAKIAAVFYNRLRAGIVLGSDVTAYYAAGKDLTDELTVEDLASDNPYNTRNPNHYGLPAGPICSPALSTIVAAANPEQVDYMFFFYSESQKSTMFFTNENDFQAAWAAYGQ